MTIDAGRIVKTVILQMAVGFAVKKSAAAISELWENRVAQLKEKKGEIYLDHAKTRLFELLSKYVVFKENRFNLTDIKAAAQLNKLPLPDVKLGELFLVCEFIARHDQTGYGYIGIPAFVKNKTEEVLAFLEALTRQERT